jgi:hypothetical protein
MNKSIDFSNRMNQPMFYRIWVEGEIDKRWYEWFNELQINSTKPGETCLAGVLPDQAAFLGFLNRLYNKGYPIIRFESEFIENRS